MSTTFKRQDLPIAFTMLDAAERIKPRRDGRHLYDQYFLLWTAFHYFYSTIAAHKGLRTELVRNADGSIATRTNGSVQIPLVSPIHENELLFLALEELDNSVKNALILHESTQFFLNRSPFWQGIRIEVDGFNQPVNGVIRLFETVDPQYPVWSPIDKSVLERYYRDRSDQDCDFLVRQIGDLLLTVRNNLLHFSRKFDDGNDHTVIENALPLLKIIIAAFTA